MMSSWERSRGVVVHVHMIYAGGGEERIRVGHGAGVTITDHYSGFAPLAMRTKRRLASALQQWHNFFQEGEQSQMVGSIANRAITDLIREGNAEGLRNFLASRKSHVDDKDEVNAHRKCQFKSYCEPFASFHLSTIKYQDLKPF